MGGIEAVFFDAGDTLMRVFPYPGPMVEWPELAAVDGAAEALEHVTEGTPEEVAAIARGVVQHGTLAGNVTRRKIGTRPVVQRRSGNAPAAVSNR